MARRTNGTAGFAVFGMTDPPQGDTLQVVIRRKRRSFMVARGRVQNGVVVLADGVRLPEGQEVTVLAPAPAGPPTHGILDIPPVSLGAVVRPFTADDDLLGETLEGRA
jgi:hypothetical protein